MSITQKHIKEYDIVRCIAVLLVVFGHTGYLTINTEFGGIEYNYFGNEELIYTIVKKLIGVVYLFHMPLFFAISGALFYSSKNKSIHDVVKNKFSRLMVPFFIVTIVFSIPIKLATNYFNDGGFQILVGQLLLQGNTHLWFLVCLFEVFIIAAIFEKIEIQCNIKFALLILLHFLSFYIYIKLISYPLQYLVWFYMGYYFNCIKNKVDSNTCYYYVLVAIFLFFLNVILIHFYNNNYTRFPAAVIGCYIIYLVSNKLSKYNFENIWFVKLVNKYSLGIYLYSDPINYIILYFFFSSTLYGIISSGFLTILWVVRMLLTFSVALFISWFLLKINLKKLS